MHASAPLDRRPEYGRRWAPLVTLRDAATRHKRLLIAAVLVLLTAVVIFAAVRRQQLEEQTQRMLLDQEETDQAIMAKFMDAKVSAVPVPTANRTPRVIWFFWETNGVASEAGGKVIPGKVGPGVGAAIRSWQYHAPDWAIIGVDSKTIRRFLGPDDLPANFDELDIVQRQADAARLALLAKYGGVYMDASIILLRPLDLLLRNPATGQEVEFRTFATAVADDGLPDGYLELYFMASRANGAFISRATQLFNRDLEQHLGDLSQSQTARDTPNPDVMIEATRTYMHLYLVGVYLIQTDKDVQRAFREGRMLATSAYDDPYALHAELGFHSDRIVTATVDYFRELDAQLGHTIHCVKLTRMDRLALTALLASMPPASLLRRSLDPAEQPIDLTTPEQRKYVALGRAPPTLPPRLPDSTAAAGDGIANHSLDL